MPPRPSKTAKPPPVVCTCKDCILHTVIVDSQRVAGRKVSSQIRRRHELSDRVEKSPFFGSKSNPKGRKVLSPGDDLDNEFSDFLNKSRKQGAC